MSTHSERHGDSKVFTRFCTPEVYPRWTGAGDAGWSGRWWCGPRWTGLTF